MDRKLGGLIAAAVVALAACSQPSVDPPEAMRSPEADNFMAGNKAMPYAEALDAVDAQAIAIPHASARGACLMAMKNTLHDPGSAEFGLMSEWITNTEADGRVRVLPRIRARNAAGALRLATFSCVVESAGGDQIRVVSLEQVRLR